MLSTVIPHYWHTYSTVIITKCIKLLHVLDYYNYKFSDLDATNAQNL